jgi:nucleoside-diphosphate-sugar epimerase
VSTTTFVTGGTGFIGRSMLARARETGRRLRGLARSDAAARELEALGVEPVPGDLLTPGPWQTQLAAADEVIHLAQPQTFGGRVTRARARNYREQRLQMDRNLLDPLARSHARILYVGGTSYYGDQGTTLVDETSTPNPKGWGPYIADAIVELERRRADGLALVQAFPGYVYGPGSWFQQYFYRPARAGKRLVALSGRSRMGSFVHVDDCAAALLHLLERGRVGERYFVVDTQSRSWADFTAAFAARAGFPVRTRTIPRLLVTAMLGPIASASFNSDCCLSSAKLRESGFEFRFATVEQGMTDVLDKLAV